MEIFLMRIRMYQNVQFPEQNSNIFLCIAYIHCSLPSQKLLICLKWWPGNAMNTDGLGGKVTLAWSRGFLTEILNGCW